jgi:hypothetical protein
MCGRYRLSRRKEVLAEHFGADFEDLDWEPRYNIAPTQPVPVIRRDGKDPALPFTQVSQSWSGLVGDGHGQARSQLRPRTNPSRPHGCLEKQVGDNSGLPRKSWRPSALSVGSECPPSDLRGSGKVWQWHAVPLVVGGALYEFHSGHQPTTALHTQ